MPTATRRLSDTPRKLRDLANRVPEIAAGLREMADQLKRDAGRRENAEDSPTATLPATVQSENKGRAIPGRSA